MSNPMSWVIETVRLVRGESRPCSCCEVEIEEDEQYAYVRVCNEESQLSLVNARLCADCTRKLGKDLMRAVSKADVEEF